MITRIVKMEFRPETINDFLLTFREFQPHLTAFQGCLEVELLQADDTPSVFFTYSRWSHTEALENYRQSDLFRKTWSTVKVWFAAPPLAWSLNTVVPDKW